MAGWPVYLGYGLARRYEIFQQKGHRGQQWSVMKRILINQGDSPINVTFSITGAIGAGPTGGVAIDDIKSLPAKRCRGSQQILFSVAAATTASTSADMTTPVKTSRIPLAPAMTSASDVRQPTVRTTRNNPVRLLNQHHYTTHTSQVQPATQRLLLGRPCNTRSYPELPMITRIKLDLRFQVELSEQQAMQSTTCTFEATYCDWVQSDKDNLQWSFQAGTTPTRSGGQILTGPTLDHTFGASKPGFYAYMETSRAREGYFADLVTKNVINGNSELEIWYYMFGLSMGSLEVVMWQSGVDYPAASVAPEWSVKGSHGDHWVKETVHIRNTATPYKIIIRARTGGRGTSDVAIDDVTLHFARSGVGVVTTSAPTSAPVTMTGT
ncbi:MAM domain-containing protein 3, partial [Elysia marginata]